MSASCSSCSASSTSSDYQAQQLQRQIDDWKTCPTTDPATKRSKVQKLESQLAMVDTANKKAEEAREKHGETDLGRNLDIAV